MDMGIAQLHSDPLAPFPAVSTAAIEPNGLLAWGGDLHPQRLLTAYRSGIFPWFNQGQEILWWAPRPRAVLYPENVYISRRLARRMRSGKFRVSTDMAFARVMSACASSRKEGTWITTEMQAAYLKLKEMGFGHSIEVWDGDELIGGLYGLVIGKMYFAESMFSLAADASKIALVSLCKQLAAHDFPLIDCQMQSPHLESMGTVTISRKRYMEILKIATCDQAQPEDWQDWFDKPLP